jgi:hypothetical protein
MNFKLSNMADCKSVSCTHAGKCQSHRNRKLPPSHECVKHIIMIEDCYQVFTESNNILASVT